MKHAQIIAATMLSALTAITSPALAGGLSEDDRGQSARSAWSDLDSTGLHQHYQGLVTGLAKDSCETAEDRKGAPKDKPNIKARIKVDMASVLVKATADSARKHDYAKDGAVLDQLGILEKGKDREIAYTSDGGRTWKPLQTVKCP
jgi:hypothetical protein